MKKYQLSILLAVIPFILVFIVWILVTNSGLIKPFFLPGPLSVLKAGIDLFVNGNFLNDIIISIIRILTGFFIGIALAIPVGVLLGSNKKVEMTFEPIIDFVRYTPIPAFIPLIILWFGIGETEKMIVIAASVFFQLVLMVANSVSHIPDEMVQFAKTLGLSKTEIVFKILFPYSWPQIFDDMRVSMGWAWTSLLIAEVVGATSGIGYVIIQSQRLLKTENVIFAIIIVGILGITIDLIFKYSQKILFPWYKKES